MKLVVAAFEPDKAPMEGGTSIASGVVAISPRSYGPIPQPEYYSAGPSSDCYLMWAPPDPLGGGNFIAVDSITGLFYAQHFTNASTTGTWTQLTPTTPATGPAPVITIGPPQNLTLYKTLIIASWVRMPLQLITLDATGAAISMAPLVNPATYPDAPCAQFAVTVKDFLFLGNTWDSVGGFGPNRVWWSALGDPTMWPAPGGAAAQQVQSDYNDFAAPLGRITGLVSDLLNCDVAIFFEYGIIRGTYVGPPAIFDFVLVEGTYGTRSTSSFAQVGGVVYYSSGNGFYSFDGTTPVPIGANRVDMFYEQTCYNRQFTECCYNSELKTVLWFYATVGGLGRVAATDALAYCTATDRWSFLPVSVRAVVNPKPLRFLTPSTPDPTSQIFTIADDTNLYLWNGPPMAAQVGTDEIELVPGRKAFIRGVRPLADGAGCTITPITRNNETDPLFRNPPVAQDVSGVAAMRVEGRYAQFTVSYPPGAAWTHIEGVDVDGVPAGSR